MSTEDEERKIAYQYILDTQCGKRVGLIESIGKDLFDEFRLIGYIKEGMDGDWNERWQITNLGKSQVVAYLELFRMRECLNQIYNDNLISA